MYRFDPTGKVSKVTSLVVAEDSFESTMRGFTQLLTPDSDGTSSPDFGQRLIAPLVRINRSGSPRLQLITPGIAETTSRPIQSMGIKRMNNVFGDGKYLLELMISVENRVSSTDRPISWGWGLDTALNDGTRRFFKVRYFNYSETSTTQVRKWQMKTGVGSVDANYVDLPGTSGIALLDVITNENKALPFYLAIEVDTALGTFNGIRFGDFFKLGSLAATPDTAISSIGAVTSETLSTFAGGMNTCFDIENRTNASRTQASSAVHWHRLTYLGA